MPIIEIDKLPPGVGEFVKKPIRVRAMQFTYPAIFLETYSKV